MFSVCYMYIPLPNLVCYVCVPDLLRSHVGLICTSCVLQFSTLVILILGLWPSGSCGCKSFRQSIVYLGTGLLSLISS